MKILCSRASNNLQRLIGSEYWMKANINIFSEVFENREYIQYSLFWIRIIRESGDYYVCNRIRVSELPYVYNDYNKIIGNGFITRKERFHKSDVQIIEPIEVLTTEELFGFDLRRRNS